MALIIEKRERQEPAKSEEDKKNGKKKGKNDSKTKDTGHGTLGDFDYYVHYIECEYAVSCMHCSCIRN